MISLIYLFAYLLLFIYIELMSIDMCIFFIPFDFEKKKMKH